MATITTSDRGELVDLQHPGTQTYLSDSFNWVRDLAAKGAREGSDVADDWSKELAQLQMPDGGLKNYLAQQDSWVANLFADLLSLVESLNPLMLGKQVAIWVLEDFRDVLRALATLVDTQEDTSEQTQDALMELALAAAALAVPYIGRAGKVVARIARGFNGIEDGLKMLRHIGPGDAVGYLKKLNLPQHAGTIIGFMKKMLGKVGDYVGRYLPKVKTVIDRWVAKISGWIQSILGKIQTILNKALAAIQKKLYSASSNLVNPNIIDRMPDTLLDWVASQINGNLCESCVDNYIVNFMGYERLYPAPNSSPRDTSAFFGPDLGIDGLFEKPAAQVQGPAFPATYSGIPLSLGTVLDELDIEIEGVEVPRQITNAIQPFGRIPSDFNPTRSRPPIYPRFVVMEAKFGFHATAQQNLTDNEWKGRLSTTTSGQRQSRNWINDRLDTIYPDLPGGVRHPKRTEIFTTRFSRWLYGCQPHRAQNSKLARSRNGRRRIANLAFFPPYAIKGFDIDTMNWNIR